MKSWIISAAIAASCCAAAAQSGPKCQADLHGFKIGTVYVVGRQYNAVAWAYKHIAENTCLTPTLDASKADAILDLEPLPRDRQPQSEPTSFMVTCSNSGAASSCIDSDGNEMDSVCDGAGNCTSSYGPSLGAAVGGLITAWIENSWSSAVAFLYTPDDKLLWRSDLPHQGSWHDFWSDKLRAATDSPECKRNAFSEHRFKNYRQWASTYCGVQFAPLVSIDLQLKAKVDAQHAAATQQQEMIDNARAAAAKQSRQ